MPTTPAVRWLRPEVLAIALAPLLLHLAVNATDGIFRDELYYLACADHLDWGYVDHPPLSIGALALWRGLLGDSVFAIRLLPALLGSLLVLLGARLAGAFGGGRFAVALSALAVAVAPQYLGITGYYSMNSFDLVAWALLALIVERLLSTDDDRWWLSFGLVAGLGLLNKMSPLFFCAGLAVALPFTPLRRHLLRPRLWLGAGLALLLVAPHLAWQVRNGWPTAEFIANATAHKNVALSPLDFLAAQVGEIHPLGLPIWLLGLGGLLAGPLGRFRTFGIVYLVALAVMVLQHGKPYYLGPAYPPLLAAGAVMVERWLASSAARAAVLVTLALGGVGLAPMAVPVLSPEAWVRYAGALGHRPSPDERQQLGPLPQFFADRHGWKEMAEAVASVVRALPAADQDRVLIVGSNYGEAAAIDYFGPPLGLPRASSQHNSYFLWGPTTWEPAVVITLGMDEESLREVFEEVSVGARLHDPWAMPYETRNPILVCRRIKLPIREAWARGRHYI